MMYLAERRCTVSSLWMSEAICGSQMMLAYSKMGPILVLCKLGVWFCVGMRECFCGGRLKLCLISMQSC